MATLDERRMTAMLLKQNLSDLYAQIMPVYALAHAWVVNSLDDDLPSEGVVKAVLERYNALRVPRIGIESALRDIQLSDEIYDGAWPTIPPECGDMTSGLFDGSSVFDGSLTFEG